MMEELRAQIVAAVERLPGGWCTAARLCGMDRTALYRAFKMKTRRPTLTTLMKIAPVVGLKVVLVEK